MAKLTTDLVLQQAIEAHKAGQVQDADRLYTAIIKAQPKHPDANHNMGVLAVGVGKVQEALPFFKTALEANPATAQYWLSYIDTLIKLEQLADARALFRQAKSKGAKGVGFEKLEQRLQGTGGEQLETNNAAAQEEQEQPNILDSLKLDQAIKLAKKKAKEGSSEESRRIYQDILTKFPKNKRARDGMKAIFSGAIGNASKVQDPPQDQLEPLINLHSQGRLQKALVHANVLLQQFPNSSVLHYIRGVVFNGLGQLYASVEAYNKAIAIKPDYADAYNNIGDALQKQGKLEEAIEAYNKALALKPDYADAYNNMGNTLKNQGKMEEAIEAYNKALALKPDYAETYYNMGIALKEQGKMEEAIGAYNRALTIKPDFAAAYNNKGNALQKQGKPQEAIKAYNKALAIKPDYANAYYGMGNALKGAVFQKPNPSLQKTISSLLDQRNCVRPSDIANAAISLLKFEPNLHKHLQAPSIDKTMQTLQQVILELSELPLLLKLMGICPLPNLGLETLLKEVRAGILLALPSLDSTPYVLEFQSVLALQCFSNEYIYDQSENEEKAIEALEASVEASLSKGKQPSPQAVLCLASYQALHKYKWCDLLSDSGDIHRVFTRQISEPELESHLKSNMPMLEKITDDVSVKVREQYEDSPYPRWVNLGLSPSGILISKMVAQSKIRLFDNEICNVSSPDILVAGCGTGQHAIGTAARFRDSKVLAIDLSLSSLAYAKRKTEELGILNIEYMQADILNLAKLKRQFNVIESAGVLHHMEQPMDGWKVLVDCLKVGGLMNIGLYSELARQHIVEMRKEISQSGTWSSDAVMKSFRSGVIASDKEYHNLLDNSPDFYSLSSLRDLLFHVQEHRFTIPQIKHCLYNLGLKFCGFEEYHLVQNFRLKYTGADDLYNLDKWQEYEEVNPHTFAGMYQFWCQKLA